MSKKIARMTFMTIIFILTLFSYAFSEPESNPINLIDEFQYKLGDCAVDENGTPLWIVNEENDWNDFKGIKELSEEINDEDTVWFRVKLPDLQKKNSGIYFEHLYANSYEIYLGSEKIYDKHREWFYYHNALVVPLQISDFDKYLFIKAIFIDKKVGLENKVLIDDYRTLQNMFLTKNLFNIYFGLGLIFIAIVIFILSIFLTNKSKKIGMSLAFVILPIGIILIISSSNFLMYFPRYEHFFLILYDISLFCLLPVLSYFFELVIITDLRFKSFIHRLCQTQTIYSIFCTLFMVVNITTGYKFHDLGLFFTIKLIGILFIIQLITLVCAGIYYSIKGNINARIFMAGFSIFAISLLSELFIFLSINKNYNFFIWIWGLIAFTISLIVIFGIQYTKNHEKLHKYSDELNRIDRLARTDYLTNLPNRMDMTNKIQKAIDNHRLNNEGFTMVLCDIDNFKNINDTYGHSFGDEVLIQFAEILKNSIGQAHTVGRWGGEEFLLLVTTQSYIETYNIIEKIRLAIKNHRFMINNTTINITATFGMYEYDASKSIEKCIEYIDEALYQGKKNGKDMVVIYEELNTIKIN